VNLYKKVYHWNVEHKEPTNLDLDNLYFEYEGKEYRLSDLLVGVIALTAASEQT
jgi:hypothetical protein